MTSQVGPEPSEWTYLERVYPKCFHAVFGSWFCVFVCKGTETISDYCQLGRRTFRRPFVHKLLQDRRRHCLVLVFSAARIRQWPTNF